MRTPYSSIAVIMFMVIMSHWTLSVCGLIRISWQSRLSAYYSILLDRKKQLSKRHVQWIQIAHWVIKNTWLHHRLFSLDYHHLLSCSYFWQSRRSTLRLGWEFPYLASVSSFIFGMAFSHKDWFILFSLLLLCMVSYSTETLQQLMNHGNYVSILNRSSIYPFSVPVGFSSIVLN